MKTFIFILFLVCNVLIFYLNNYCFVLSLFVITFLVILGKRRLMNYLKFMLKSLPYVLIMFLCNLPFSDFGDALFVSARFLLSLEMTYLLICFLSPLDIGRILSGLLSPLRVFGVNTRKAFLIISVALTFVPVLINEGKTMRKALAVKGYKSSLKNILVRPNLFIVPFINNLFNKIEVMEKALIMKGVKL